MIFLSACKSNDSIEAVFNQPFSMNSKLSKVLLNADPDFTLMRQLSDTLIVFVVDSVWYIYDMKTNSYDIFEYAEEHTIGHVWKHAERFVVKEENKLILVTHTGEETNTITFEQNYTLIPHNDFLVVSTIINDEWTTIIYDNELQEVNREDGLRVYIGSYWISDGLLATSDNGLYVLQAQEFVQLFELENIREAYISVEPYGYSIQFSYFDWELNDHIYKTYVYTDELLLAVEGEGQSVISCVEVHDYYCTIEETIDDFNINRYFVIYDLAGSLIQKYDISGSFDNGIFANNLVYIEDQQNIFTVYDLEYNIVDTFDFSSMGSSSTNLSYISGHYFLRYYGTESGVYMLDDDWKLLRFSDAFSNNFEPVHYILEGSKAIHILNTDGTLETLEDEDINSDFEDGAFLSSAGDKGFLLYRNSEEMNISKYDVNGNHQYNCRIVSMVIDNSNPENPIHIYLLYLETGEFVFLET